MWCLQPVRPWVILLLLAVFLTGCGSPAETLHIGLSEWELPLQILAGEPRAAPKVAAQMFEGLIRFDDEGVLRGGLARTWDWDETFTRLTLHLRDGVRFHDGSLLTADDVVRSLRTVIDDSQGGGPERATWLGRPRDIAALDDSTVWIELPAPHPALPRNLTSVAEFPIMKLSPDGSITGTGPFLLERVEPGHGRAVLSRHEAYWGSRPLSGRLVFHAFDEPEKALDALESRRLDLLLSVSVGDLNRIRRSSGMSLIMSRRVTYVVIGMNNRRPPFSDREVREALWKAIDWQALARRLYPASSAEPTGKFVNRFLEPQVPDHPDRNPSEDASAARQVISSLPVEQRRVRIVIAPSFSPDRRHWVLNVLGPALGEVGLILEPDFTEDIRDAVQKISSGEWEISFDGLHTETGDLYEFLYTLYAEPVPSGGNGIFFMDGEEVAWRLERAAAEVDSIAAVEAYYEVLDVIARQVPCIPFCELPTFGVRSDEVEPFAPGPFDLWLLDKVRKKDR